MATHLEDYIDVETLQEHLRTAMFSYQEHAKAMGSIVEKWDNDELPDDYFIRRDGAEMMKQRHTESALEVERMLEGISKFYYGEDEEHWE